ncbi:MAG: hypothetical protein WC269_00760, partial [Candidatus Gracilibacteria bacterium]
AKVIVEFFDGTILRLKGGSDIAFEKMQTSGEESSVGLILVDGDMWVNKVYENAVQSNFSVEAGGIVVGSGNDVVFEVSKGADVAVRGVQGKNISVNVLDKNGDKVVETESIGIGQEMVVTDKALEKYWQYQSPSIVSAINDEFKMSEWYLWNKQEDEKPTEFEKSADLVKVEPEKIAANEDAEEAGIEVGAEGDADADADVGDDTVTTSETVDPLTPVLVSVANQVKPNEDGFFVVESRVATISGTVINTAAKISVNDYVLTKFKTGDTTWNYYANADFGFMKPGENVYEIYASDAEGKKGGKLEVKILYKPREDVPPTTVPTPATENPDTSKPEEGV